MHPGMLTHSHTYGQNQHQNTIIYSQRWIVTVSKVIWQTAMQTETPPPTLTKNRRLLSVDLWGSSVSDLWHPLILGHYFQFLGWHLTGAWPVAKRIYKHFCMFVCFLFPFFQSSCFIFHVLLSALSQPLHREEYWPYYLSILPYLQFCLW